MRNSVISIFLALCLIAPLLGIFAWLQLRKAAVRKEVKHGLIAQTDRSAFVLLKFHRSELDSKVSWEHSKEFKFEGRMYDIVEHEVYGDTLHYWCWLDAEETELNTQLNNLVIGALQRDSQHNEGQKRLVDFFRTLYFSNSSTCHFDPTDGSQPFFGQYVEHYLPPVTEPASPPPQLG